MDEVEFLFEKKNKGPAVLNAKMAALAKLGENNFAIPVVMRQGYKGPRMVRRGNCITAFENFLVQAGFILPGVPSTGFDTTARYKEGERVPGPGEIVKSFDVDYHVSFTNMNRKFVKNIQYARCSIFYFDEINLFRKA